MEEKLLVIGEGREVSAVRDIIEALQKEMVLERIHERTEAALLEDWKQLAVRYPVVSVVVADPKKRLRIIAKLEEYCCTIMTLIHPESVVSPAASLGKGCMICPMAVIEAGSVLGTGVWVKAGAIVEGDCLIGDACCLESGSIVKAGSIVPPGTTVQSGEVFCQEAAEVFKELQNNSCEYSFEVGM